jgi:predicted MFS family arabinose efflux permease
MISQEPESGDCLLEATSLANRSGHRRFQRLGRSFWTLYASSCLIDLGLCLYFFMFNLFLIEHNFTVHNIGFITAALTVGTIAGTVIVSLVSRHLELRKLLLTFICAAPLALSLRLVFLQVPAQIGLAFFAGFMMSIWSVCFSPTLAKLTTQENRTFGFSLFVATGIGSGVLAGLLGGYLPGLFRRLRWVGPQGDGIKVVLFLASAIIMLAAFSLLRLRLARDERARSSLKVFSRFLVRFLIVVATWNFAISFFVPFANVYLSQKLGLSTMRIGEIFTLSQLVQVAMVLLAPILYRRFGLVIGIAITQVGTALLFFSLSRAHRASTAIFIYVLLTGLQWMGGPGLSSLLMNRTAEVYRSQASALHNLVNLAAQASATVLAGTMFEALGYSRPLAMDAVLAALAGILMYTLLGREDPDKLTRFT